VSSHSVTICTLALLWAKLRYPEADQGDSVYITSLYRMRMLEGVKVLHMVRKEQVKRLDGRGAMGRAKFVESLFQIAS
jgi:hypothetical protein